MGDNNTGKTTPLRYLAKKYHVSNVGGLIIYGYGTSRRLRIKQVLTSGILPDVSDFRFTTTENLNSFVEVQTDYGWIWLNDFLIVIQIVKIH